MSAVPSCAIAVEAVQRLITDQEGKQSIVGNAVLRDDRFYMAPKRFVTVIRRGISTRICAGTSGLFSLLTCTWRSKRRERLAANAGVTHQKPQNRPRATKRSQRSVGTASQWITAWSQVHGLLEGILKIMIESLRAKMQVMVAVTTMSYRQALVAKSVIMKSR